MARQGKARQEFFNKGMRNENGKSKNDRGITTESVEIL